MVALLAGCGEAVAALDGGGDGGGGTAGGDDVGELADAGDLVVRVDAAEADVRVGAGATGGHGEAPGAGADVLGGLEKGLGAVAGLLDVAAHERLGLVRTDGGATSLGNYAVKEL